MAKTVLKCDVSGCDTEISHKNNVVARRMLGIHKRRVHDIKGVNVERNSKYKRRGKKSNGVIPPPPETVETELMVPLTEIPNFCEHCGKKIRDKIIARTKLTQVDPS